MFTDNCFLFLVTFHRSLQSCPSALSPQTTVFCRQQESKWINLIWVQGRFKITLMVLSDDLSMKWGQISILIFLLFHKHSALLTMRVSSHLISPQTCIPINKELNNQRELSPAGEEIPTVLAPPLEGESEQTQVKNFVLTACSLTEETKKVQPWIWYRKLYRTERHSKVSEVETRGLPAAAVQRKGSLRIWTETANFKQSVKRLYQTSGHYAKRKAHQKGHPNSLRTKHKKTTGIWHALGCSRLQNLLFW